MALPFVSVPHTLAADDVFPVELLSRICDRANDAAALVEFEHGGGIRSDGVHGSFQIPYAVAYFRGPGVAGRSGSAGVLVWADGFRSAPVWNVSGSEHSIRFEANAGRSGQATATADILGGRGARVTLKNSFTLGSNRYFWTSPVYDADGFAKVILPSSAVSGLGQIEKIDSVFLVVR